MLEEQHACNKFGQLKYNTNYLCVSSLPHKLKYVKRQRNQINFSHSHNTILSTSVYPFTN